jgi:hypothetical protein
MPTLQLLKLAKQFTVDGEPVVGYTVAVAEVDSNVPVALFASADANTKRLPSNKLVTDASGAVAAYVKPGNYRLSLLAPDGSVLATQNVQPSAANVRGNELSAEGNFVDVDYAASITPVIGGDVTTLRVGQLTGNITVANPAGTIADHAGKTLVLMFEQDGGGSRTVTWGNQFKAGANTGTTGRGATMFVCDGTNWLQVGQPLTFR